MKSVSVYIPFKDSYATLREVLPAIEAQSYPIHEIILVDDSSEFLSEVPQPTTIPTRTVRHPRNLGVAAARNTALKEAKSELIVSFDADIVPEPDCVAQLVDALAHDLSLGGAGGRVTERYAETTGDLFRAHFMKQDRGLDRLLNVDLFGGCTVYRRAVLLEIGGYTEMLRNSFEDFDVSRRVKEKGWGTAYLPNARAEHIKRDTVISAVDTLYRWSYPHWESDERLAKHNWIQERIEYPSNYYESAVSSRVETLDFKLRSDLTLALERIKGCEDTRILYPLILYPVRAVLRDLVNYHLCKGAEAPEVVNHFGEVLALLLRDAVPTSHARQLQHDIEDLIEKLYGITKWNERCARELPTGRDMLALLEGGDTAGLPSQTFIEFYSEMLSIYAKRHM